LTADALNEALGLLLIRILFDDIEVGFNDLEFEGRASAIKDEDIHRIQGRIGEPMTALECS
jgi:hypothetical protein